MATRPLKKAASALLSAFALACAHAYAWGQFSLPYDPDFSESAPAKPAAKAPEQAPPSMPAFSTAGAHFLLLERPDVAHPLPPAAPASTQAAPAFSDFLLRQRPFQVDQGRWDRVRALAETGELPGEEFELPMSSGEGGPGEYVISGATTPPQPPAPEVELPTYGTSLSITGRKVIGFTYSEKRYLSAQTTTGRAQNQNLIDIEQQLQLRMVGKVGPKISVNVDYDDTKTDKQDISVVYQGDPNEVVQNASFGDIDLSLPATEFVSYNKQLFGIRVELKYKRLKALFIGSRTKGTTHAKQFKGNTQFTSQDITDTSYIRRRYYDLAFGDARRLPIVGGSVRVFLSLNSGAVQNVNQVQRTVDDLAVPSSTFTGIFTELASGIDFTVDNVKGILTFRNSLDPNAVVAVELTDASGVPISRQSSTSAFTSGGTGNFKLIKTFGDVQIATVSEAGFQRELKTFYSLGASQIMRDDGRGNFFLQVL
ncbi:MAG: hypothetical protein KGL53_07540, partial [Elusimicrobia bacterium]|nr:hypothetical protein [Elusimicrobiota bacterium]